MQGRLWRVQVRAYFGWGVFRNWQEIVQFEEGILESLVSAEITRNYCDILGKMLKRQMR
jgi:hypothetical protein